SFGPIAGACALWGLARDAWSASMDLSSNSAPRSSQDIREAPRSSGMPPDSMRRQASRQRATPSVRVVGRTNSLWAIARMSMERPTGEGQGLPRDIPCSLSRSLAYRSCLRLSRLLDSMGCRPCCRRRKSR
ncbi:unnamed protein product, partial [Symbiodinium sp. CCMP2592]